MKTLKYTLLLVGLMTLATQVGAQKFGYVNSAEILQNMPEVKQANSALEALQTQLQKKGQQMVEEFQAEYKVLQEKDAAGALSPKELEIEGQKMREKEAKIVKFEQDIQKKLAEKQQTELTPILDRVNQAIKDVAKDNGYTYIFDTSPGIGVVLYADESTDVTTLVKAKLGM